MVYLANQTDYLYLLVLNKKRKLIGFAGLTESNESFSLQIVGKQYNKVEKRKRRNQRLKRKKTTVK